MYTSSDDLRGTVIATEFGIRPSHLEENVSAQVAIDVVEYLDRFSSHCFGIRKLAKETGLNEKTIKRLAARENRPTYQTLFKLYSVFKAEDDYEKLLARCPTVIAGELRKQTPCRSVANTKVNTEFLRQIQREPLLAELWVLSGTGPVHKKSVLQRYGQYGVELLKRLEAMSLIEAVGKAEYVASSRGPNLDGPALKFLGEYFVHKFLKAKNHEELDLHAISFYAEGLNEDGRKAWQAIDREAFYRKLKIANDPKMKGSLPMFTFAATDTITTENIND